MQNADVPLKPIIFTCTTHMFFKTQHFLSVQNWQILCKVVHFPGAQRCISLGKNIVFAGAKLHLSQNSQLSGAKMRMHLKTLVFSRAKNDILLQTLVFSHAKNKFEKTSCFHAENCTAVCPLHVQKSKSSTIAKSIVQPVLYKGLVRLESVVFMCKNHICINKHHFSRAKCACALKPSCVHVQKHLAPTLVFSRAKKP